MERGFCLGVLKRGGGWIVELVLLRDNGLGSVFGVDGTGLLALGEKSRRGGGSGAADASVLVRSRGVEGSGRGVVS